jgi:hypothetical protein
MFYDCLAEGERAESHDAVPLRFGAKKYSMPKNSN